MRTPKARWSLLALFVLLASPMVAAAATTQPAGALAITLGRSIVVLNRPWRFHTGDDARWADPNFDDSSWETVDLTPAPGAHDPDVGLKGYVPGWTARGHPGYAGYGWYRMRLALDTPPGEPLALAGPLDVDGAYQAFANGRLLGGSGIFSSRRPVVYVTRPQIFPLSPPDGSVVLAIRVWTSAREASQPQAGGIRIAPAIGQQSAILARHQIEWQEKFLGYIFEVTQAIAFVLLAVMALSLRMFDRSHGAYDWMAAALVLLALARANQAIVAWTDLESLQAFVVFRYILLDPLILGAWLMAWRAWFALRAPSRLPIAIGALTLVLIALHTLARVLPPASPTNSIGAGVEALTEGVRLAFAVILASIAYFGVRLRGRQAWLALPALALIAVGLFAQELSDVKVPGIWFPFGIGVSRTNYAYAAFNLAMFALLLARLRIYARRLPAAAD